MRAAPVCCFMAALSVAVGCSESEPAAKQPSQPLSARIELAEDAVAAGDSIDGEVIVTNNTGEAFDCFSCTVKTLSAPVGDRSVVERSSGKVIPANGDCFAME